MCEVISSARRWREWLKSGKGEAIVEAIAADTRLRAQRTADGGLVWRFGDYGERPKKIRDAFPCDWSALCDAYSRFLINRQATLASKAERLAARESRRQNAAEPTVGALFYAWLAHHTAEGGTQAKNYGNMWNKWLAGDLNALPASQLLKKQKEVMSRVIGQNGCPPSSAARLCTIIGTMARWANVQQADSVPGTPLKLKDISPATHKETGGERDTVIPVRELVRLWFALTDGQPGHELVRWLILTGVRKSEARLMTWGMIYFEPTEAYPDGRVVLPGEIMKQDKPHAFPLSPEMKRVLARMPGYSMGEEQRKNFHVFPSPIAGGFAHGSPLGINTANQVLVDFAVKAEHVEADYLPSAVASPHDIRRSFVHHGILEADIDEAHAEMMIAHSVNAKGAGKSYNHRIATQARKVKAAWATMARWWDEQLQAHQTADAAPAAPVSKPIGLGDLPFDRKPNAPQQAGKRLNPLAAALRS